MSVLVTAWVARHLGPEQYGSLSFAMALVGIFTAISSVGLQTEVVKQLVTKDNDGGVIGTALALRLLGGVVAYALVFVAAYIMNSDHEGLLILSAIIGAQHIVRASEIVKFWFEARLLSIYIALADISAIVASSIAKIIVIMADGGATLIACTIIFDGMVAAVLYSIAFFRSQKSQPSLTVDLPLSIELMQKSWPYAVSGFLTFLQINGDKVLLGMIVSKAEVGVYAIGSQLYHHVTSLLVMVEVSIFPVLAGRKSIDTSETVEGIANSHRLVFLSSVALSAIVWASARPIIIYVFGPNYEDSVEIFQVLAFMMPLTVHLRAHIQYFRLTEQPLNTAWLQAGTTALTLMLIAILVPAYGILGASYASLYATIAVLIASITLGSHRESLGAISLLLVLPLKKLKVQ